MAAFLENIEPFRGTGEKNEQGLTLEAFLDGYNADKYPKPSVTADIMVFSYKKEETDFWKHLKLLMVKRRNHPSIGFWALPGGFANMDEDLIDTARRELEEETSIKDLPLVQFFTYGEKDRDPRDRVITTAYISMVEEGSCKEEAGDDAKDAAWWSFTVKDDGGMMCVEDEQNVKCTNYYLEMTCEKEDKKLSAVISEHVKMDSILKETYYKVEKRDGIAFDHARYIVMGYLYLKEKLV